MKFTKMHGCGNDYVYVDARRETVRSPGALARAVSDRHAGVGADGLILITPSRRADFRMVMFNADGSRGEMCGNGVRCVGKYVYDRGLTRRKDLSIETGAGLVSLVLHVRRGKVDRVTVDMGPPRPVPRAFHVRADGARTVLREKVLGRKCSVVSMGNPHCVILVDSVERAPVPELGPAIERHPDFPSRINVEFVEVLSPRHVRQRTWERGSGETLACGTGACAVAAALGARSLRVDLRGGTLRIETARDGRLLLTGPAVEVFRGEWPTNPLRGR